MKYEELLKKYMRHVMDCEGISFVDHIGSHYSDVQFTDEEKVALERAEDEVRQ